MFYLFRFEHAFGLVVDGAEHGAFLLHIFLVREEEIRSAIFLVVMNLEGSHVCDRMQRAGERKTKIKICVACVQIKSTRR